MAKILLSACLFFCTTAISVAQVIVSSGGGTGTWADPNSWNPATVPTAANSTSVLISHTITAAASVPLIDNITIQSGGALIINAATVFTLANGLGDEITVNSGGTITNNGTLAFGGLPNRTVRVSGSFNNSGTITGNSVLKFFFDSGSNYFHQFADAGAVPLASWNPNSTVNIVGYTSGNSTPPTGLGQTFGHFVWNAPGQDVSIFLGGLPAVTNGDFTIIDTGIDAVFYSFGTGGSTLNVGGDLNAVAGVFAFSSGDSGPSTLNVNGDINIIDGYVQFADDQDITVNLLGDFLLSSTGQVDFSATIATTDFNLEGDFIQSGGSLFTTGGVFNLNFVGTTVQTYTSTISPVGIINYFVGTGSTLNIPGTNFIGGSGSTGTFTMDGTLQVGSTHASGAIQTGFTNGNVRVNGTRTYAAFSTIEYNGIAAQFLGNGHPTGASINTVINNSVGVTLAANTTLGGDLTLTSGNLSLSTRTLTLNADFIPNSNFLNLAVGSSIVIGGSGALGTLATTGSPIITNFTLDRSGLDLNLGGDLSINGTFTQTAGNLLLGSHLFRINGAFGPASPGGNITGGSGSSFLVAGSGTLPTSVSLLGTIGTLSMNRTGSTLTTPSGFTVTNLSLLSGIVANSTSMAIATGGTILRTGSGSMTNTPSGTGSYNVSYLIGSPVTAGPELPVSSTRINDVTINGGATLTLAGALTTNGILTIGSGGLNSGANNVTVRGNFVSNGSGTLTGSTLICDGTTTISGSSIPVLGNLQVTAAHTLTMPASIDIAGSITLNSTSVFNAGSGLINLTGSGTQTISATGKNFNNITVLKSGGAVDILPTLNLVGILDIQSATAVQSNGNLVLVSTSDGPTGNASIAALGSGASVTGNVVVQRRMSAEGRIFRDISSPVQGATVQQIMNSGITVTGFTPSSFPCAGCATNNPSMFFYNEAATGAITLGYTGMTSAGQTLTPGRGYNVLVRAEVGTATSSLTGPINSGTINYGSVISFTSTPDPAADGWNFVGNPYPSTIDWDNGFTTKTNIQGNMISIWDAGANGYKTWNGSTGSLGSGMIAQGQGFWFQASAAPGLVVTEASKVGSTGTFYRKETEPVHTAEIIVKGPGVEDRAYFQKTKGASLDFDQTDGAQFPLFDGFKISTLTNGANQRKVSINTVGEIPEAGEIPLIIENVINGEYHVSKTVMGDFAGTKISIRDGFTNDVVELADGTGYKFTITDNEETRNRYRFTLVFGDLAIEKAAVLFPNPVIDKVTVRATSEFSPEGVVVDNTGKQLGSLQWSAEGNTGKIWHGNYDMTSQAAGLYFVKVQGSAGVDIVKFLKK